MVLPSDASSSCRTTEDERIRAAEADDDDDEPPPQVVDRDPSGRFIRYAEPLGKGAYKTVWRAFDEEEGVEVAWNQLRVDHLTTLDAGKLRSEVTLLSALRHPNVIRLYYAWTAPAANGGETVYFVTELMTSGTLKRYLRKTSGGIRPKFLKLICRQVLSGLSYLHNCHPPVIHRDLKCENIFVNGNTGEVKLGDLGLATVKPLRHVTSVIGTPEFMAPELYDEKYDEKVDVYAFGMCVLEMVTKDYPYSECTNQAQIYKKVTNGIKPLALDKIEQGPLRELIEACLRFNPEERPTAAELLHHPFLTAEGTPPMDPVNAGMPPQQHDAQIAPVTLGNRRSSVGAGVLLGTASVDTSLDLLRQPTGGKSALSAGLLTANLGNSGSTMPAGTPGAVLSGPGVPMLPLDLHRTSSLDAAQLARLATPVGIEHSHSSQLLGIQGTMVDSATLSAPTTLRQVMPPAAAAPAHLQPNDYARMHADGMFISSTATSTAASTPLMAQPAQHGQVDLVKRQEGGTLLLKMTQRRAGDVKPKCVKFPFVLDQDTPEDVVDEMVREEVLDEADRNLAVRNIRQTVSRVLATSELVINTAIGSVSSNDSGPQSASMMIAGIRRSGSGLSSGRSQDEMCIPLARHTLQHAPTSPVYIAHHQQRMSQGHSIMDAPMPGSPVAHSPGLATSLPQNVPLGHRRSASSGAAPLLYSYVNAAQAYPAPGSSPGSRATMVAAQQQQQQQQSFYSQQGLATAIPASLSDSSDFAPPIMAHSCMYPSDPHTQRYYDPHAYGLGRGMAAPVTRPGESFVDYRDALTAQSPRRASVPASHFVGVGSAPGYVSSPAAVAAAAAAAAHSRKRAQSGPSTTIGTMLGQSTGSSPRSDHGELTAGSTAATGNTSLGSPLFGSPRLGEDGLVKPAKSPGVPASEHAQAPVFAEVLVARAPSTAGIGVTVDPALADPAAPLATGISSPPMIGTTTPLIPLPLTSPTHGPPISPPHPDHLSPRSSAPDMQWGDDELNDLDINDPSLIELGERQRREAEEMARIHTAEWDQLVRILRDQRSARRNGQTSKSIGGA